MEKKLLVVVDMQNDFIDGVLGSPQAQAIVPKVCEKIKGWDGDVLFTMDTHTDNYSETTEGIDLPVPHCIRYSDGWQYNNDVEAALNDRGEKAASGNGMVINIAKTCFGDPYAAHEILALGYNYVELIGLCTDVCVISNAVMIRNQSENMRVVVDASCCAGVTPEKHRIALEAMKCCGIKVIGE